MHRSYEMGLKIKIKWQKSCKLKTSSLNQMALTTLHLDKNIQATTVQMITRIIVKKITNYWHTATST